jgi:polyferredoxin
MGYPRGLIRYSSENALKNKWNKRHQWAHLLRPRILIYSALLLVLIGLFVGGLASRDPLKMNVMRDRGVLSREIPGGLVENVYQIQLMNTTEKPRKIRIEAKGLDGLAVYRRNVYEVPASSNILEPLEVTLPVDQAKKGIYKIEIKAVSEDNKPISASGHTTFIVP